MTDTATTPAATDLASRLTDADQAYYDGDDSGLSDAAYDTLKRQLADMVDDDPSLLDEPAVRDALTEVGTTSRGSFAKADHSEPMLSLDNAFTDADVDKFVSDTARHDGVTYEVAPKFDGVSLAITYAADPDEPATGRFVRAVTRGDGTTGDVVSDAVAHIADIPLTVTLPHRAMHGSTFEVRGEVVIPRSEWDDVQAARRASGKDEFANRRNAAAGGVRNLDMADVAARHLHFRAYSVVGLPADTSATLIDWLPTQGFAVVDTTTGLGEHDVADAVRSLADAVGDADEDRDGVVVKVEQTDLRTAIGGTSKHPSWAVAVKPAQEQATTTLVGIEFATGKTGRVAGRFVLDPVKVGGTTVTYATAPNPTWVAGEGLPRSDFRIGDTVVVQRAGAVIPELVEPVIDDRDGSEQPITWPDTCPDCGSPLDFEDSKVVRCFAPTCPSQLRARLEYAAGRDNFDLQSVGPKLIDQMLDADLLGSVADLLHLTATDVLPLDRIGQKKADRVEAEVRDAVTRLNSDPKRLISALGIRNIGRSQARELIDRFGSVDAVRAASQADVEAIDGFGPERARSVVDGLADPRVVAVLDRCAGAGIDLDATPDGWGEAGDAPLDGFTFVLTGALTVNGEKTSRNAIHELLESLGGSTSGSMSAGKVLISAGYEGTPSTGKEKKAAKHVGDGSTFILGQDALDLLLSGQLPEELS